MEAARRTALLVGGVRARVPRWVRVAVLALVGLSLLAVLVSICYPSCPRLGSNLRDLLWAWAPDREEVARRRTLDYEDGSVRVEIELAGEEGDLAQRYNLHVEARGGRLVLALAPVDNLCALSKDPRVRFVQSPARHGPEAPG